MSGQALMSPSVVLPVTEPSGIGKARRTAVDLAVQAGFTDTDAGAVAITVTELATNLVKHARDGRIVVRARRGEITSIEILSLDRGPGIADVGRCLRDGYSTAGSPGTGLGAVMRAAATFDVESVVGLGTAILAVVRRSDRASRTTAADPPRFDVGAIAVPHAGESVSGDAWAVEEDARCASFLVADGLGHGLLAADAAGSAVDAFNKSRGMTPGARLEALHAALRPTRGAAVGVAQIDTRRQVVTFAGIGNIAAAIVTDGRQRQMVSHPGIMGHDMRRVAEFTYPWTHDSLLVMTSDGLTTHWHYDRYPGLVRRHPSLVAGMLWRDFARGRDDATVLVARERASAMP
jgi:anti-sigma regulatory factor (Ser/Thr protein kinase)